MRKKVLATAFAIAMLAGIGSPLLATGAADAKPADKVTICHATHSEKNPFVIITVSENAANAHDNHQDDEDLIGTGDDCTGGEEEEE